MANARMTALKALLEVDESGAFSNIALDRLLGTGNLLPQDRALATALFYGVLDRKITLDYVLANFISRPISKTGKVTLTALRIALYQIMYMDRIPPSAAVNQSVELVKKSPERYNASFTNGVLRNILRHGVHLPNPDTPKNISIVFSCPLPIVDGFITDYGLQNTVALLEHSLLAPPVTVRVNTLKTDCASLCRRFGNENITVFKTDIPNALNIESALNIHELASYGDGLFHIQDAASQISISKLAPASGERVLDVCAAPGGKSFTMAELMQNAGSILALDIHEHRVKLIENGVRRLGLNIITAARSDATALPEEIGLFDAVLCDVPCSGLGVIRRKPEIKYKSAEEFETLPALQHKILSCAARHLKSGGRLLYSTCTLRIAENEDVVRAFLENNRAFTLRYEHTFMPHIDGTDGFYCALITKV